MLARAKRLGWNQADGIVTDHDELETPAWIDDGLDPVVEGEVVLQEFPADETYRERKVYTINGQIIDPETIEQITE